MSKCIVLKALIQAGSPNKKKSDSSHIHHLLKFSKQTRDKIYLKKKKSIIFVNLNNMSMINPADFGPDSGGRVKVIDCTMNCWNS
jgi:hypothetical protein